MPVPWNASFSNTHRTRKDINVIILQFTNSFIPWMSPFLKVNCIFPPLQFIGHIMTLKHKIGPTFPKSNSYIYLWVWTTSSFTKSKTTRDKRNTTYTSSAKPRWYEPRPRNFHTSRSNYKDKSQEVIISFSHLQSSYGELVKVNSRRCWSPSLHVGQSWASR